MIEYPNTVSVGLHAIPSHCPLCGDEQYNGEHAIDHGSGEGIEDLFLGTGELIFDPALWTVCHVECKYLFRDAVVNDLVALGGDDPETEDEYNRLHEAIRDTLAWNDHSLDHLIAMVGVDYMRKRS